MRTGVVTVVAGRTVTIYDGKEEFEAKLRSRALKVLVGDRVSVAPDLLVQEILPRKSTLMRTFGNEDREFAANIDLLIVVTALDKLFNSTAIDRALTIASAASVPVVMVANKVDLGDEPRIKIYEEIGHEVFALSAKFMQGIEKLVERLETEELSTVALLGVSGVGKSTLLNRLVPDAEARTAEVSDKIGQGRQTTSQALGYVMPRRGFSPLVVVDLPGSQYLGVSHLSPEIVLMSFEEFLPFAASCKYSDCKHIAEPECGVKTALEQKKIAASRYESYTAMLEELRDMPDARRYRKG